MILVCGLGRKESEMHTEASLDSIGVWVVVQLWIELLPKKKKKQAVVATHISLRTPSYNV